MQLPPKQTRQSVLDEPEIDLSRWGGKSGLIYLVREAVEEVDWPHKTENFSISDEVRFQSTHLMTLEVYCYARGVYRSDEVEGAVKSDEALKDLFPGRWPDPRTILKYRRVHRDAIVACLNHVFQNAFVIRFGEPNTDNVPIDHCVALALDRWFEPICGPSPGDEASERIDRAIFWDGMAAADRG